jgi:hypothetical protein
MKDHLWVADQGLENQEVLQTPVQRIRETRILCYAFVSLLLLIMARPPSAEVDDAIDLASTLPTHNLPSRASPSARSHRLISRGGSPESFAQACWNSTGPE